MATCSEACTTLTEKRSDRRLTKHSCKQLHDRVAPHSGLLPIGVVCVPPPVEPEPPHRRTLARQELRLSSLCDCASDALFRFGEPFKVVNVMILSVHVGQVNAAIRKKGGSRRGKRNFNRRIVYVAEDGLLRFDMVADYTSFAHALDESVVVKHLAKGCLCGRAQPRRFVLITFPQANKGGCRHLEYLPCPPWSRRDNAQP